LSRLRLTFVAGRLDAFLSDAVKSDKTFLEFLDGLLDELASKQRKRVTMEMRSPTSPR
jgi:hypothetical protein